MKLSDLACEACHLTETLLTPCQACTSSYNGMSSNTDYRLFTHFTIEQTEQGLFIGNGNWTGGPFKIDKGMFDFLRMWIGKDKYMTKQRWDAELLQILR